MTTETKTLFYDRLQAGSTRTKSDGEVVSLGGYEGGVKLYIKVVSGYAYLLVYLVNTLVTQAKIDRVLAKTSEDGCTITANLVCLKKQHKSIREYKFRFFDDSSAELFYSTYTRALIINGYDEDSIPSFEDIQEQCEYNYHHDSESDDDSRSSDDNKDNDEGDDNSNASLDDVDPSQDIFALNTLHPFSNK